MSSAKVITVAARVGLGGDTSNDGVGTFYEGVVTKGYSSDEADDAVQANIIAARYGMASRRDAALPPAERVVETLVS